MPLVDYPSDSDSDAAPAPPPKKLKSGSGSGTPQSPPPPPPLPQAFLDLYTTNVRASPIDDPSLHQGRKRQMPHVAGNWPSHVYIEWHPSASQHAVLARLLQCIRRAIGSATLHSLLENDLGARAPLHVSLSRPVVVSTARKDAFLAHMRDAVSAARIAPFGVRAYRLYWYTSPDSARTFLVLSISSAAVAATAPPSNAQLAALVARCNSVVEDFDQPALYAADDNDDGVDGLAFHISVAWTFDVPSDAAKNAVNRLFDDDFAEVKEWEVPVDNVKVKIGNIVTSVPLKQTARIAQASSLFT